MNKILISLLLLVLNTISFGQTVDFTYVSQNDLFCNPSLISFTASAPGAPQGYVWNFGNGTVSNSKNPSVRYTRAGNYRVELIVIYKTYTRKAVKEIEIFPAITASIRTDRDYICTPGDIEFTVTSNLPATYEWTFGDGSTVETTESSIAHPYSEFKSYDVTMKATSENGCFVTKTTKVKLEKPSVKGTTTNNTGCIPAVSRLTTTATIPKNSSVTSYTWDFKDGSAPTTTTSRALNHTFSNPGAFEPEVTVTTSEGCTNTFTFDRLGYGTPPEDLTAFADEYIFCGSDSAVFHANAKNANLYVWDFGDGKTEETTSNTIKHKYTSLGVKTVTVTPSFNDCPAPPQSFEVEVIGVIAGFRFENTCEDKKTFTFTNTSKGKISSLYWSIADGSPNLETRDIVHSYPDESSTRTTLYIEDEITGCKDRLAAIIYTSGPALTISDTSVCRGTDVSFRIENNYESSRGKYTWFVAGKEVGPVTKGQLTVNADSLGIFKNAVVIDLGRQYCNDTIKLKDNLRVHGPLLDFNGPDEVCFATPYSIQNQSKPFFPGEEISTWHWNYGETTVNDTIYQPQPYFFGKSGTFPVRLHAADILGCVDSLVKEVKVNALPFLYLVPQASTLCLGETDSLFAFYNGSLEWKTDIDLPCTDCDTLVFAPQHSATLTAVATSRAGCAVEDSVAITVQRPFSARAEVAEPYICLNDSTQISIFPGGKRVEWSPAPLLYADSGYNAIVSPLQSTTYSVTLSDSSGCFTSTANATVNVKSLPKVDAGPDQVLPYNSTFTITPSYSGNVHAYNWLPSQSLSCTTCPSPSGVLLESQTYFIDVVSDSGCVASDSLSITIECKDANLLIPNAFTPNGDNLNDAFYPIARGIKTIKVFAVFDRYGKLVFEQKNILPNDATLGWDGRRNGVDQDSNVYVYYLEAECFKGEILKRRGTVTLIR